MWQSISFSILSHANMPLSMILLGVMLNFTLERKYIPATIKYLCLHYGLALVWGIVSTCVVTGIR